MTTVADLIKSLSTLPPHLKVIPVTLAGEKGTCQMVYLPLHFSIDKPHEYENTLHDFGHHRHPKPAEKKAPIVHLIARDMALDLIPEYRPNNLRNYEIERLLKKHGEFIVAEWCTSDGTYCRYFDVATISDLRQARQNCMESGLFAAHHFDRIEEAIAKRGDMHEDAFYTQGAIPLIEEE